MCLFLSSQDDVDVMRCICAGDPAQKDSEQAAECRERGNSSFRTRDYTAAALHYTQVGLLLPDPHSLESTESPFIHKKLPRFVYVLFSIYCAGLTRPTGGN